MDLTTEPGILSYLSSTPLACTSASQLTGGYGNRTWRGVLKVPIAVGKETVIIKHAQDLSFTLSNNGQEFKFDATRLEFEQTALSQVHDHVGVSLPTSVAVTVPEVYSYDKHTNILIMEDAGQAVKDLKATLIAGAVNSKQAAEIGRALAAFLSKLHDWGKSEQELCKVVQKHYQAISISLFAYYGRLVETIDMFPGGIFEQYRDMFGKAQGLLSSTMRNDADSGIIHGDFWPGNILVSAPGTGSDIGEIKLHVIDWELSKLAPGLFDIGQMAAELFLIYHFKRNGDAILLLDSFLSNYRGLKSPDARWKIAIHFGTHLVVWPIRIPGWGTAKQIEECAKIGAEFIQKGLEADVEWLQQSALGGLFASLEGSVLPVMG